MQEAQWAVEFDVATPDEASYFSYVDAVLAQRTTADGVFGATLFWLHLQDFLRHTEAFAQLGGMSAVTRFREVFGPNVRAVWLRRNCLDAALSLWRAEVTNVWFERPGDPAPPVPAVLDTWRVTTLHAEYHAAEVGWPHFLFSAGIPYMSLQYSEVARDVPAAVAAIAAFVGVDAPVAPPVERLRRQGDAATLAFAAQWVAETGGCDECRVD